jgi:hypothetical protein
MKTDLMFRATTRNDGVYLYIEGLGPPFRFRLGSGTVQQLQSDSHLLWVVEGEAGEYLVQLIHHPVVPNSIANATESLIAHFRWEMDFVKERLGIAVDQTSISVLEHLAGTPMLTWITQNAAISDPDAPGTKATTFAAHATLLHLPDHLLHFAVTGIDDQAWTEEELRIQVLRVALSYFRLNADVAWVGTKRLEHISQDRR